MNPLLITVYGVMGNAKAFAGDKLRRDDRYGAFSFPDGLSSLMMSDFRLTIEISA